MKKILETLGGVYFGFAFGYLALCFVRFFMGV